MRGHWVWQKLFIVKEQKQMKSYRISIEQLRSMVREQLSKHEKERRRRKGIFGIDSKELFSTPELDRLARGIISDDCEGNSNHDSLGKFSSNQTDGSYSYPKAKGCKRKSGQFKRKGTKVLDDRSPCGRKDRKRLCKEDKGQKDLYYRERLESLIRTTIKDEIAKAAKANNCTMNDILRFINTYEKAEKGRLDAASK